MWNIVLCLHLLHLSVFWVTVTGIRCIYYRTQPIDMHLCEVSVDEPIIAFSLGTLRSIRQTVDRDPRAVVVALYEGSHSWCGNKNLLLKTKWKNCG